jgi:dTDP-4-dehydrorhamnose 3,5-epimerase
MFEEVTVKPLKRYADERGFFAEIFRSDWKDLFPEPVVQSNLSITYPGVVRAWHKHERGQVDYFIVIDGAIKICTYDEESGDLAEVISTGENLQIVKVPGKYWHGFKVIGNKPAILIYFVNKMYDYEKPDELRRPWNDPTIVPKKVNGREDDPRCNKPWDWFHPPHR